MSDKEALEILKLLEGYISKSIEAKLKNVIKTTTATIVALDAENKTATIKFPYDDKNLIIPNKTSDEIAVNDEVIVGYWGSLSNAFVMMCKQ